jgi:transaldolase
MQHATIHEQKSVHTNPLRELEALGQSIWIDVIRRGMLAEELPRLIAEDGVSGVTSNPSIWEKAIGETNEYDADITALTRQGRMTGEIFEALAVADLQRAADMFRPIYDRTAGRDGFISMEVSPHLVHDTDGSINEARRFWAALDRPNVFIKIPATDEGIPAIRQLISEGINVNITLLFGLPRYEEVIEAYLGGLEERLRRNQPVDHVASVASFFLSRIDVLIDPQVEKIIQAGAKDRNGPQRAGNPNETSPVEAARAVVGETAIASAKIAYQIFSREFGGERFRRMSMRGAQTQKLLWASTSTKNPAYPDIKYVAALIGPDTINTLPLETLAAFRDHGVAESLLESGVQAAHDVMATLPKLGIDIDRMTQQLEDEGAEKFSVSFNKLMRAIEEKRALAQKDADGGRGS